METHHMRIDMMPHTRVSVQTNGCVTSGLPRNTPRQATNLPTDMDREHEAMAHTTCQGDAMCKCHSGPEVNPRCGFRTQAVPRATHGWGGPAPPQARRPVPCSAPVPRPVRAMSADIETMRANAGNRLLATDTALSSQRHEEALGTRMTHKTCSEHLCCTRRRNLKAVAPAEGLLLCATR